MRAKNETEIEQEEQHADPSWTWGNGSGIRSLPFGSYCTIVTTSSVFPRENDPAGSVEATIPGSVLPVLSSDF